MFDLGDLLIAFVFYVLGWLTPPLHQTQFWRRIRTRQAHRKALALLAEPGADLSIGRVRVPDVRVLYAFPTPESALSHDYLVSTYTDKARYIPQRLRELVEREIPALRHRAEVQGATFSDDPGYDLQGLSSERLIRDGVGERIRHPKLAFGPTSFFPFAALNLQLDKPLVDEEHQTLSIREFARLQPENVDPEALGSLPIPLPFGTNTVLLTSDNLAVLSERSGRQFVEPGAREFRNLHVIGEGMLRPADSEEHAGTQQPDPFRTVIRALAKELALHPGDGWSATDIRWLGLFLDLKRLQPIGVFILKTSLSFETIAYNARRAEDGSEHRALVPLRFEPDVVRTLLANQYTHLGKPCRVTSNQAQASLVLALFYSFRAGYVEQHFRARAA